MEKIVKLYDQGFSIHEISGLLSIDKKLVEEIIIEHKLSKISSTEAIGIFDRTISLVKNERLDYLMSLSTKEKHQFVDELTDFLDAQKQNAEDVMASLWIIGELKLHNFSHYLCKYSSSANKNIKRITYSSMGKIHNAVFIPYLKTGCKDNGIQVRMYAIKSLAGYHFQNKYEFFCDILKKETNPRNREILQQIINDEIK